MKTLARFRISLLAAALVPILLLSSSAFSPNASGRHDQRLSFSTWYMPLCTLNYLPGDPIDVPDLDCQQQGCQAFIAGPDVPGEREINTAATGTFSVSGTDPENHVTSLKPKAWTGVGQDEELGVVTWSFDVDRDVPVSTIASNQADGGYPATADLYFHITGTFSSRPQTTYRSLTAFHLRDKDVLAFNPFNGEVFTLVDKVDFEDVDKPGEVAFTLSRLTLKFK